MKWLFAVLVALNIIVFGGMVAHRMTEKQPEAANALLEGGTHELARPASLEPKPAMPSENAGPDWIVVPENNADIPEPESEEAIAARKQKEREEKLAKEKKAREEKARREKEAQQNGVEARQVHVEQADARTRQCVSAATVSMDEDDYHRIKGLLTRWPHAASRSVEKRSAQKGENAVNKTFRVLLPSGGDAMAQLEALNNKGFTGVVYNGEISMGVTRSRSAAQILISRLSGAGFGGARILEQEEKGSTPDGTLSVSRMTVTFMAVGEHEAQDIRNVVGRYGHLNVRSCR
ncbi:cell division protein [Neisseria iguanae]|uniref:Cell division protein n=1 Tax=Neisseria iguanae TaxID=90242 RepID=A0A2P7U377_9NEIS|nr:cell division protein [Neisseria iguanae]PSJ81363.1 cell division protein [Neisseria iguanae]